MHAHTQSNRDRSAVYMVRVRLQSSRVTKVNASMLSMQVLSLLLL